MFVGTIGTIGRVQGGAGGAATTWNPADKSANIALSADNLTATSTAAGRKLVRATKSANSGLLYFELKALTATQTFTVFGLANSSAPTSNYVGSDTNGIGYLKIGQVVYGGNAIGNGLTAFNSNDTVMVAVNFTTSKIWFGINGVFGGSPASGDGGYALPTGSLFPAVSVDANDAFTLNVGGSPFTYTPPSGFSAWG